MIQRSLWTATGRAIVRATGLALHAVLGVLVEDACVICRGPSPGCRPPGDGFDVCLTRPVVVRHYRIVAITNHPVCAECAAKFSRSHGVGSIGIARGSEVSAVSGHRFGQASDNATPGAVGSRISLLAPFMTDDRVLALVHQVKFSGYWSLADTVAAAVSHYVAGSSVLDEINLVVPVPMAAPDRRRRRHNLPDVIAQEIARECGILCYDNVLEKIRTTRRQSQTATEDRAENVRGAYRASAGVEGRGVLVVDDLVTSGATAADCCAALLSAGAGPVAVACFGRAL